MNTNSTKSSVSLELEEDDRYWVYSRAEILAILRAVQEQRTLVTITFHQGKDFVITTLLYIDPESQALVFDYGPDESLNQALANADRMTIITEHNNVKVLFRSQRAEEVLFDEKPAFRVALPEGLMRLQRREFFRVAPSMGDPLRSQLPVNVDRSKTKIEVNVLDISCGGVALIADSELPGVQVGQVVKGVQIELPEIGIITADVEIRNISQYSDRNDSMMKRIGCQFVNLPGTIARMVQKYIINREVARKKLD